MSAASLAHLIQHHEARGEWIIASYLRGLL